LILKLTKVITGHPYGTRPMALPPDGKTLASADVDRTVKLGDIATGEKLLALGRFTGTVWILRFSQDGNVLATMGSKAPREAHWELFLWRTAEHETRAATSGGGVVRSC